MIKGKTKSGFSFEVDERIVKDYSFVKLVAAVGAENASDTDVFINSEAMMERLLGKKGKQALIKHVENDGISDIEEVYTEFSEVLEAIKSNDNEAKK